MRTITKPINQEHIGAPQIVVDPRSGRLYAVYNRDIGHASVVGVMRSDDHHDKLAARELAITGGGC